MKKKLIIGAGILLTVFLVFLIVLCGGTGTDKIVTKEELDVTISKVVCEVKDSADIEYDLSLFTNDNLFESNISSKNYTKATLKQEKGFKSLGVAFMMKSNEDTSLNVSLNLNGTSLKTTTVSIEDGKNANVNLILDEAVEVKNTDEFTITFEQSSENSFVFDMLIFFFDEV